MKKIIAGLLIVGVLAFAAVSSTGASVTEVAYHPILPPVG